MYVGLSVKDIFVLKWEDVVFEDSGRGKLKIKDENGVVNCLPITRYLTAKLKQYRENEAKNKIHVFFKTNTTPLHYAANSYYLRVFNERFELEPGLKITAKLLQDTYVKNLLDGNASIKAFLTIALRVDIDIQIAIRLLKPNDENLSDEYERIFG